MSKIAAEAQIVEAGIRMVEVIKQLGLLTFNPNLAEHNAALADEAVAASKALLNAVLDHQLGLGHRLWHELRLADYTPESKIACFDRFYAMAESRFANEEQDGCYVVDDEAILDAVMGLLGEGVYERWIAAAEEIPK